jgi:hypothetical protein
LRCCEKIGINLLVGVAFFAIDEQAELCRPMALKYRR